MDDVADVLALILGTTTNSSVTVATVSAAMGRFSVTAYGATGNGSTDDTTAIQAALNAAVAASGGAVYFPAGTYKITSALTVPNTYNGLRICGAGIASNIVCHGNIDGFDIQAGDYCWFDDLLISNAGTPTSGNAISFTGIDAWRIDKVKINGTWNGVYATGTGVGTATGITDTFIYALNWACYTQSPISIVNTSLWAGSIGFVWDGVGTVRLCRVDLAGPLGITTRNSLGLTTSPSPDNGIWCTQVEFQSEAGTNPSEGPGAFNFNWASGYVHLVECVAGEAGVVFGGNVATQVISIIGGEYGGAPTIGYNNGINIQAGSKVNMAGVNIGGAASSSYDSVLIAAGVTDVTITGCYFWGALGQSRYHINSAATGGTNVYTGNTFAAGSWTQASPVNYPSGSAAHYTVAGNSAAPNVISQAAAAGALLSVTNTTSSPTAPNAEIVSAASGDQALGLQVSGDTNQRLQVSAAGSLLWGSGSAAGDVKVDRAAADQLRISEVTGAGGPTLKIVPTAAGNNVFGTDLTGDSAYRFLISGNGAMQWGPGSAGTDAVLQRSSAGVVAVSAGSFDVSTAGQGLRVAEGSNAKQGTATLSGGAVVVSNTSVTSSSRILLTAQSLGTVSTAQALAVTARSAGTSFTITSASASDTSVVAYEIFEPG
jgi:hypothetical protein